MLLIPCPFCGPRDQIEFTYGGDATLTRPDPATASEEAWAAYVYLRDNPKGPHSEYWHHHAGCRAWIKVRRDTLTHEISASAAATAPLAGEAGKP
ncbi:MAG TPA: sarcosine oxidase subunit delta [Stellaceae bacterium]|nr:sarcosine oxidase subunit delta [Stellaceae bacterium]